MSDTEWVEPPTADDSDTPMCFYALVNVCVARGSMAKMNTMCEPGQCVKVEIDERWTAWINPHNVDAVSVGMPRIPPCAAYVEWNGWPWGTISPSWQECVAHESYEGANPARFVRDCRAAFERAVVAVRADYGRCADCGDVIEERDAYCIADERLCARCAPEVVQ